LEIVGTQRKAANGQKSEKIAHGSIRYLYTLCYFVSAHCMTSMRRAPRENVVCPQHIAAVERKIRFPSSWAIGNTWLENLVKHRHY